MFLTTVDEIKGRMMVIGKSEHNSSSQISLLLNSYLENNVPQPENFETFLY